MISYITCKGVFEIPAIVIVALAFIPNNDNKPCIDHINTKRDDNRVENLRWCTIKENTKPKFLLLIGNKSDMTAEREVNKEDINSYCEKNSLNYIEISAKNNDNVEQIFKEVAFKLYSEIKLKKGSEDKELKEFQVGGYKNITIANEKKDELHRNSCCKF